MDKGIGILTVDSGVPLRVNRAQLATLASSPFTAGLYNATVERVNAVAAAVPPEGAERQQWLQHRINLGLVPAHPVGSQLVLMLLREAFPALCMAIVIANGGQTGMCDRNAVGAHEGAAPKCEVCASPAGAAALASAPPLAFVPRPTSAGVFLVTEDLQRRCPWTSVNEDNVVSVDEREYQRVTAQRQLQQQQAEGQRRHEGATAEAIAAAAEPQNKVAKKLQKSLAEKASECLLSPKAPAAATQPTYAVRSVERMAALPGGHVRVNQLAQEYFPPNTPNTPILLALVASDLHASMTDTAEDTFRQREGTMEPLPLLCSAGAVSFKGEMYLSSLCLGNLPWFLTPKELEKEPWRKLPEMFTTDNAILVRDADFLAPSAVGGMNEYSFKVLLQQLPGLHAEAVTAKLAQDLGISREAASHNWLVRCMFVLTSRLCRAYAAALAATAGSRAAFLLLRKLFILDVVDALRLDGYVHTAPPVGWDTQFGLGAFPAGALAHLAALGCGDDSPAPAKVPEAKDVDGRKRANPAPVPNIPKKAKAEAPAALAAAVVVAAAPVAAAVAAAAPEVAPAAAPVQQQRYPQRDEAAEQAKRGETDAEALRLFPNWRFNEARFARGFVEVARAGFIPDPSAPMWVAPLGAVKAGEVLKHPACFKAWNKPWAVAYWARGHCPVHGPGAGHDMNGCNFLVAGAPLPM